MDSVNLTACPSQCNAVKFSDDYAALSPGTATTCDLDFRHVSSLSSEDVPHRRDSEDNLADPGDVAGHCFRTHVDLSVAAVPEDDVARVHARDSPTHGRRLPTLLVQPVVIKNTFIDVDDGAVQRKPRRNKTEGASPSDSGGSQAEANTPSFHFSPRGLVQHDHEHVNSCSSTEGDLAAGLAKVGEGQAALPSLEEASNSAPSNLASGSALSDKQASFQWTVDAKKLRGNDRSVVSRPFTLSRDGTFVGATFKMMLYAKTLREGKGGQSFKMSRGRGSLQLKCERDLGQESLLNIRFSIGGVGGLPRHEKSLRHDFAQSAACTTQDWDFSKGVDEVTQTFVVSVELL